MDYASGIVQIVTARELRKRREALGLTQGELANRLGVHWSTVARWEQGVRQISEPVARLIQIVAHSAKRRKGRL